MACGTSCEGPEPHWPNEGRALSAEYSVLPETFAPSKCCSLKHWELVCPAGSTAVVRTRLVSHLMAPTNPISTPCLRGRGGESRVGVFSPVHPRTTVYAHSRTVHRRQAEDAGLIERMSYRDGADCGLALSTSECISQQLARELESRAWAPAGSTFHRRLSRLSDLTQSCV